MPGSGSAVGACRVGGLAGRAVSAAPGQCRRGAPGLAREHGVRVSLRTVERAVADLRRDLLAEARACVRFETPPGRQLQIDFGSTFVPIGGEEMRVYLFVATLGYSRRGFVAAFGTSGNRLVRGPGGGLPALRWSAREDLLDNAKPLVVRHDAVTREVVFNERLHAFARYWGFRPRACAPYRARTKGKDENGVGYVKKSRPQVRLLAALEAHLADGCARLPISASMAPPASRRSSGPGGRRPRHWRRSWPAAVPAGARGGPACAGGRLGRSRHQPLQRALGPIGARVRVEVTAGVVCIFHAGVEVARHDECRGRRERVLDPAHLVGVIADDRGSPVTSVAAPAEVGELLRPLAEYEQIAGGGW